MTTTPYSPDTACALGIGATSSGFVRETDVTWDGALDSYNLRSIEQRSAVMAAYLRDSVAALRAVLAPPTATVRIMCAGDSITVGTGSTATGQMDAYGNGIGGSGYRPWLVDLLAQRRIAAPLTVVAQGGQTLRTMTPPILAALPAAQPDIVLIYLGTNDIGAANDAGADWQSRYASLVDQILASSSTVKVVCGRLAHYRDPGMISRADSLNTLIDGVVNARKAAGRVTSADMSVLTGMWTSDGTHPVDAAYVVMAQQWTNAITPWLPAT
jgi:lysophospholipase L1-like esterase